MSKYMTKADIDRIDYVIQQTEENTDLHKAASLVRRMYNDYLKEACVSDYVEHKKVLGNKPPNLIKRLMSSLWDIPNVEETKSFLYSKCYGVVDSYKDVFSGNSYFALLDVSKIAKTLFIMCAEQEISK